MVLPHSSIPRELDVEDHLAAREVGGQPREQCHRFHIRRRTSRTTASVRAPSPRRALVMAGPSRLRLVNGIYSRACLSAANAPRRPSRSLALPLVSQTASDFVAVVAVCWWGAVRLVDVRVLRRWDGGRCFCWRLFSGVRDGGIRLPRR